jgi:predicted amidohydrolase
MRAAALQFFAIPLAVTHNLDLAERLIRQAAQHGANLIVLPALFNTGYVYSPRLPAAAEPISGPTTQWLQRLSAELNICLCGSLLIREDARVFHTALVVEPAGRLHTYRQRHRFVWEPLFFEAGHQPLIAHTPLGRVGLMLGWDISAPDLAAYRGNVDVMILASAMPRLHRAVLNFPLGRKVYLAELTPEWLRERDRLDQWLKNDVSACAAELGAPMVHAAMAGRLVTVLPWPRLSFGVCALRRPRFWAWIPHAAQATMRATFYGTSAIYDTHGEPLATVDEESGMAFAALPPAQNPTSLPSVSRPHLSLGWRWRAAVLGRLPHPTA